MLDYFLKSERKGMVFGGLGGGEYLEEAGEENTLVRIYCIKRFIITFYYSKHHKRINY